MKKRFKIFFVSFLALLFSFFVALYFSLVFIFPLLINSNFFITKFSGFIFSKTGVVSSFSGLKVKVTPKLDITAILNETVCVDKNYNIIVLKGLEAYIPCFNLKKGKINLNSFALLKTPSNPSKKGDFNLNFSNLPEIHINNAVVNFEKNCKTEASAAFSDILLKNNELSFNLKFTSKYLFEPIIIKNANKISFSGDKIIAKDFEILFKNSSVYLNGILYDKKSGQKFTLRGANLPVYEIENAVMFFVKQKTKKKNFMENFTDFKGIGTIDLIFNGGEVNGVVILDKLSAKSIPFSVPLFFERTVFHFEKKDIFMSAKGKMGGEDAVWNFLVNNVFTSNAEISGNVEVNVSNAFSEKYIDDFTIEGQIGLNVDYMVKNGVVDVLYSAEIKENSDIFYSEARLGLKEKNRKLQAATRKTGDFITLVNYSYSITDMGKTEDIIYGTGNFEKIDGKYALKNLFAQTKKNAPVSLLGFLENRLKGGFFNGNIDFDFVEKKLKGSIILEDTIFRGFKIKNAAIFGDDNYLNILANGTFQNEPFYCDTDIKNNLKNELHIEKLELYLKKYVMQNSAKKDKTKFRISPKKTLYTEITAKNINLRLDEFQKDKILINNIELKGSAKDGIFHFQMPDVIFAEGKLSAKGFADFKRHILDIYFQADEINSNVAAYQVFNLEDNIRGKAYAKLHATFLNRMENLKGDAFFQIKKGSLPKIGTTEFVIKRSKRKNPFKFSISDVVKIDKSAEINPNSNITGNFKINNNKLDKINLYMQNDAISLYIEGDYDINNSNSNLNLWGKYDREIEREISIFHIPLSWVTKFVFRIKDAAITYKDKLLKVPAVKSKKDDTKKFSVKLNGNLNDKKSLKVELRGLE